MKRYLICSSEGRDFVPHVQEADDLPPRASRHTHEYWAIDPQAVPPTEVDLGIRDSIWRYSHWAGLLPENWLDLKGNLRGKDGRVIFAAGEKGST